MEPVFSELTWIDAWCDGVDDTTPEDVHMKHKPLLMITRGWVLKNDEIGVSMFYERCLDPPSFRGRTFVPAAMVRSLEPYPKPKPRRARLAKSPEIEKGPKD